MSVVVVGRRKMRVWYAKRAGQHGGGVVPLRYVKHLVNFKNQAKTRKHKYLVLGITISVKTNAKNKLIRS